MSDRRIITLKDAAGKTAKEYVQVVCVVEDRHDITGEPRTLRVLTQDETVDLRQENQFVIVLGELSTFDLTTKDNS